MIKEKELIAKLQELKHIKPRQEWVSLAKANIFAIQSTSKKITKTSNRWSIQDILQVFYQRRFAYALASFLLIFGAIVGVVKYGNIDFSKNSTASVASIATESDLKSKVEELKTKSEALVQVAKDTSEPTTISSAVKEVKDVTKNLTETIQKNPKLVKSIALEINNNQSLSGSILNIPGGGDLKVTSDDLYKTIDTQMIMDLKTETLTDDQKSVLANIEASYTKGDYMTALRDILLMNASINNSVNTK